MKQYLTAHEVSDLLGVSVSKAYNLLLQLNKELKKEGYITISGKCPVKYFEKKYYGFVVPEEMLKNG